MTTQTTIKTRPAPTDNELEAMRRLCLSAYDAYCAQPTIINRKAWFEARDKYEHIKSLYAAGRAALIQKRVIEKQS